MSETGSLYAAFIGDIQGSRGLAPTDRAALQTLLARTAHAMSVDHAPLLATPAQVTAGDDIKALFLSPAGALQAAVAARAHFQDHGFAMRFGIGYGALSTPLDAADVGNIDGPCFHRARGALEAAKRHKRPLALDGCGADDATVTTVIDLVWSTRDRWTPTQRKYARAAAEGITITAVARRFRVTKGTVSNVLRAADHGRLAMAEQAVIEALAARWPEAAP